MLAELARKDIKQLQLYSIDMGGIKYTQVESRAKNGNG